MLFNKELLKIKKTILDINNFKETEAEILDEINIGSRSFKNYS